MPIDGQPAELSSRRQRGKIIEFLRRNLFKVELSDGQLIVAAMPQSLLHVAANARHGQIYSYVAVEVELRERPKISRITKAYQSGLIG